MLLILDILLVSSIVFVPVSWFILNSCYIERYFSRYMRFIWLRIIVAILYSLATEYVVILILTALRNYIIKSHTL